ncbi:MAG TPA: antibiotic biosynthesis monooxygenase [Gammaproteobacteria bacterium]
MPDENFAATPEPPYYAVIFTSQRTAGHSDGNDGYGEAADRMAELAATMPGFLGIESARDANGFGITVSYWQDEASIKHWRENAEHAATRKRGRNEWYEQFDVRVAKVERAYGMTGKQE